MKQQTSAWLQTQRLLAHQQPERPRHGLSVEGELIGSIEESLVGQLGADALKQYGLELHWRNDT